MKQSGDLVELMKKDSGSATNWIYTRDGIMIRHFKSEEVQSIMVVETNIPSSQGMLYYKVLLMLKNSDMVLGYIFEADIYETDR